MTDLEHDGRASLRVEWLEASFAGHRNRAGWYVIRTCACHRGRAITAPLDSRADAEQAVEMLDEDVRRMGKAAAP